MFEPGEIKTGDHHFAVGTAGSTMLVLQAVLPALLQASGPTTLTIEGGTHNLMSPPFDFLQGAFLPILARMGVRVEMVLEAPGFYPAGGGRVRVTVHPGPLKQIELHQRGEPVSRSATARLAQLARSIGNRELKVLRRKLDLGESELHLEVIKDSKGPGNVVTLELAFANITEVFTGFGERGKRAEHVATDAYHEAKEYLRTAAPVGRHLADQLLIPMALAGGGSFTAMPLSLHSRTNIDVVEMLLDADQHDQFSRQVISTFLREWLKRHIFGIDKKLEAFILASDAK